MAKIVRVNGDVKAFASAALGTERTLFGEVTQANDLTSQFTADFLRGWGIVGPSDQPTLEDFNGAMYTNGQLSAYLHQIGIAEYNAAQEYHIGSLCNVAGVVYSSLINTNVGNTPASSPSQWRELYAAATETLRGSVELATAAETVTGTSTSLATHPAGVAAAIAAAVASVVRLPQGYLSGFALANNSGAPNTTLDVAPGSARDSTNTVDIATTTTLRGILQSSGAWAAGDNQNKLDAGAKAINSTYYKFAIGHPTMADDILYSLSPTAPTMPSGYVGFRRIGRAVTDASGNIRAFKDRGNGCFDWVTPIVEVTFGPVAASTSLLTVTGLALATARMQPLVYGDAVGMKLIATDQTDSVMGATETDFTGGLIVQSGGGSATESGSAEFQVYVDASSQVRMRTFATGNMRGRVLTVGYKENR
jgi:hypothetical protein